MFSVDFLSDKLNVRHNSTSGIFNILTYKPYVRTTWGDTNDDNFHQVWSWYDSVAELQRCWCGHITWPWPFDRWQWSYMAGDVVNPASKFEDPTPISSQVMSYYVCRSPPLTMRLEPLRMRHITWSAWGQILAVNKGLTCRRLRPFFSRRRNEFNTATFSCK